MLNDKNSIAIKEYIQLNIIIVTITFQGQQRDGLYPSGLAFTFLCEEHCPVEARGAVRIEQMNLRKKYQITEGDLDQIPGRNRHIHIFINIYVYIYVCIYIYLFVHIHTSINIDIYIYIYI
jgi:hypothetical protein